LHIAPNICPLIFAADLQRNPGEGFSKTPRVPFENVRAPVYLSAPSRSNGDTETLLKIQLIKFNLMVSADCEPTSVSRPRPFP
jgi:hypothetical protein